MNGKEGRFSTNLVVWSLGFNFVGCALHKLLDSISEDRRIGDDYRSNQNRAEDERGSEESIQFDFRLKFYIQCAYYI